VASLSHHDLVNIKASGDGYLRQLVDMHEREQQKQREDVGRERERER
jgi:hypothetical protein